MIALLLFDTKRFNFEIENLGQLNYSFVLPFVILNVGMIISESFGGQEF